MPISNEQGKNYVRYWYLYIIGAEAAVIVYLFNLLITKVNEHEADNRKNMDVLFEYARASAQHEERGKPENFDIITVVNPADSSRTLVALPRSPTGFSTK